MTSPRTSPSAGPTLSPAEYAAALAAIDRLLAGPPGNGPGQASTRETLQIARAELMWNSPPEHPA